MKKINKKQRKIIYEAVKNYGGMTKFSREIGISRQAAELWLVHGIPPRRVMLVEKLTGVPRETLNPEIYPPPEPKNV